MNRRKLIRNSLLASPMMAAAVGGRAADSTLLSIDEPIAVALNYVEDATTVDPAKYPKKAGADGASQNCASCALYTQTGEGVGTCTAIPGRLVRGGGWCSAWVGRS
jgi:hypothetical protein